MTKTNKSSFDNLSYYFIVLNIRHIQEHTKLSYQDV